jgi:predicted ABC-type ATPase
MTSPAQLIVLAGPNGAGKSTLAPHLLRDALGIREFVNADTIAAGLAGYSPEAVALEAGKIMLQRVQELLESGHSFAIETTLSGRTWLKLFRRAKEEFGYEVTINYLWIDSAELAVERVGLRTRHGAHFIPEETVRRRYQRVHWISLMRLSGARSKAV